MSLPEVLLWQLLRRRGVGGLAFRRQRAFGPYVADFYCHEALLVVEIDGKQHEGRVEEDRVRDAWFAERGVAVVRVRAQDVLNDAAQAAAMVLHEARKRLTELERERRP
jgi:very-short-patch-repair endonuclease